MASQVETKKRLALAVIDFLSTSLKDGTISAEDAESVEVAQQGIADAFHVDASDKKAMQDAIGNQSLFSIYSVYEKLKGKTTDTADTAKTPNPEAEAFKSKGNAAMQQKDYPTAIELYSKAINVDPTNPIYLSNRAAAYSASNQHAQASSDAELAVAADPKYTKAWSRLGFARFALGDAKGSMEAYQKGIEYEGNGGSDAMKKGFETAKKKVEEEGTAHEDDASDEEETARGGGGGGGAGGMPDLASLAGMLGGGRGGGGPDLSSIMNNPMFANMAQNLMSNPDMMSNLMNNPTLRDMASNYGSGRGGGGMPDLGSLMSDPSIAEL
ncbi:MAG: hypothetical protein GOMPHAMPRED_003270 [Gomphillus americanus]|uniref:SGTA homodimerisation domain-containing protein n=1 Tax=Gomphillus americanus TaxID=1940652 RepID=A0A8H3EHY4_9LECA|nr:MAG: hypothetical protein GOMPHAMPRED_003270 [Gomphillus americanus]